ncbi:MAG: 6-phosphofructokinase [Spirochaetales bacterium]|nr:6-phosphofructokinase [Spirochaetales bacterium]
MTATKRFGILTAGGDCPGLNPAIRGICKAAFHEYGMEIIGIHEGYKGLVEGKGRILKPEDFSGIIHTGGTILGTSRERPFKDPIKVDMMIDNYKKWGLDALVVLGGNGSQKRAYWLSKKGLNVIGLPKTIDNDVFGSDMTFGFHTALDVATDAVDRLHTTAHSHRRVLIAEVMGNEAGWLALYGGIAGGADVILIPEIPYDVHLILKHLKTRLDHPEGFSVIVIAEGARSAEKAQFSKKQMRKVKETDGGSGLRLSKALLEAGGIEARVSVLGYLQRGGAPVAYDRVLATQFGTKGAELLARGDYGRMVALKGQDIVSIPLEETAEKTKLVPVDHLAIHSARLAGTCFGD